METGKMKLSAIARELGLSVTTVSRVLHNRPDVKAETRKRVLDYVQGAGFYPGSVGSDVRMVGVVDSFRRHSLASYYNASLLEGIDQKLYELGYVTSIVHAELIDREHRSYDNVRLLNRLAGLVWLGPVFDEHYRSIADKHNIPTVVVNCAARDVAINHVEVNSRKAAATATEYLLGLGHSKIAFIGGQMDNPNMLDRVDGYRAALAQAGITPDAGLVIDDITLWNEEGGAEGVYRLMSRGAAPTALIVASDFLVAGVYRALRELGYEIPYSISVVSFDDSPIASYVTPPVTSCQQPLREIATLATDILTQRINAGRQSSEPVHRVVNMPFIVRQSTASPESEGAILTPEV